MQTGYKVGKETAALRARRTCDISTRRSLLTSSFPPPPECPPSVRGHTRVPPVIVSEITTDSTQNGRTRVLILARARSHYWTSYPHTHGYRVLCGRRRSVSTVNTFKDVFNALRSGVGLSTVVVTTDYGIVKRQRTIVARSKHAPDKISGNNTKSYGNL